jgi:chromosome segregation ATPase
MSHYQEVISEGPPWATPAYERSYDVEAERRRDEERYDLAHEQDPAKPNLTLADIRREQAARAAERSTMSSNTTMSAAEAAEAREKLRAYTAAQKAARAARRERREERAEEWARHKQAEAKAQERINALNDEVAEVNKRHTKRHDDLGILRVEIKQLVQARKAICGKLDAAYVDRAAARSAIQKLHAEIRGDNGDGAEEVDHD